MEGAAAARAPFLLAEQHGPHLPDRYSERARSVVKAFFAEAARMPGNRRDIEPLHGKACSAP